MVDFPNKSFEDLFLQFIIDVSKEYVKEEIISEKQREQIIRYHQDQIERDQKVRNEILGV